MLKSKFVWNELNNTPHKSQASGLHPEIERLFLNRNLGCIDALKEGRPFDNIWHDPFKFKDMQKVVDRVNQAIEKDESILVYGDYDADGTTSTAILVRTLRQLGARTSFYIPHRFFEGYGPNEESFMQAIGEGHSLVIAVDCGISAINEANLLKEHDVDYIIIDHHHPKEEIPHAYALIHPEFDKNYPFDYLAGAGVSLKVAEALKGGQLDDDDYVLAMFGTIGDVVILIDENRTIVKRGLSCIRKTKSPGIQALLKVSGVNQYEADETAVGFGICPRLNAPGRMDDASVVVELLLADDEYIAKEYASDVDNANNERKTITSEISKQAVLQAEEKEIDKLKALVLYSPDWHEGVLGIVASKIVEKYGKAVVVLAMGDEGLIKGSARAPGGLNILDALIANDHLLAKYGGHESAAGMTLSTLNPNELEIGLNIALENSKVVNSMNCDLLMELDELDFKWYEDVQKLSPFGQGNKRPIVKITDVYIKNVKRIGATHEHLKFHVYKDKISFDAIFFGGAKTFVYLTPETKFSLLCEIEINEWNNNKKLQIRIIDIKCDELQLFDLRNQKSESEFSDLIKHSFVIDQLYDTLELLKSAYLESGFGDVVLTKLGVYSMPTRNQFIFVFQAVKNNGPFALTPEIINYFEKAEIPQPMLVFVIRVFYEVGLFNYNEGIISINNIETKVDYTASASYINRKAKSLVHEFLELSTPSEILNFVTNN